MSALDFINLPNNYGLGGMGMPSPTRAMVQNALDGAVAANEDTLIASRKARANFNGGSIQRRGSNLPGDTGQNFGLNQNNNFGDYGQRFYGSREVGGELGHAGFSSGGFGDLAGIAGYAQGTSGLSATSKYAHYKMASAVSAYKGFGIIKNVIDLMANFASEGLTIKHKRKNIEKFYKRWAEHVGLQERVGAFLRAYYKTGNVHIYTTMGQIDQETYTRMKKAKANTPGYVTGFNKIGHVTGDSNDPNQKSRTDDALKENKKPIGDREIPWRYQVLNPFQMEKIGTEFFGESEWIFIMDPTNAKNVKEGKLKGRYGHIKFLDETETNLPREFKKLSEDGLDTRIIKLDQDKLWTLFYMKDDHEDWADPMIWPVMKDIYFKNKLRQMDISVCNSVINSITIFKLGDWKNGFVPPKEHFRKFSEYLRTPSAAMTMVWNDAVDVVSNHPPVDKILGMQKYESVDRDILRGLGVSDTLIGGATGGNFSTGFLGVRTLLERLEEGRNAVLRWLNNQLRLIAATMGHRDIPVVKFGKMSLRDEKAEKQLILGLLDRNVISVEAVLELFGENFEIELERLREEKKIADDEGILVKHGPFTEPMAIMTDEEVMDKEDERLDKAADLAMKMKKADKGAQQRQIKKQGQNGRPSGTEGIPQEKKRETKPKGMAWIIEYEKQKSYSLAHIESIEKVVTETILTSQNKKYKKSLSKDDRQGIEEIVFAVASNLDHLITPTIDVVQKVIQRCPRINSRAAEIYASLSNSSMGLSERKTAMASAIATYEMEEA